MDVLRERWTLYDSLMQGCQPVDCSQLVDCHLLFCQSVGIITVYVYAHNSETDYDISMCQGSMTI